MMENGMSKEIMVISFKQLDMVSHIHYENHKKAEKKAAKIFKSLDGDGDGWITEEEVMASEKIERVSLKLFCLSLSLFLLLILSSFLLSLLLSTFTLAQPQLCRKPVVLRFLPYTLKLVFLSYIYLTPSHTLCRFSPFLTISLLVSYPTYRRTVRLSAYIY